MAGVKVLALLGLVVTVVVNLLWIALLWHLHRLFDEAVVLKARVLARPGRPPALAGLRRGSTLSVVVAALLAVSLLITLAVQLPALLLIWR